MILIADGGSTKCDWKVLDESYNLLKSLETKGFNPNTSVLAEIPNLLDADTTLKQNKHQIKKLFYYGAGCGLLSNQEKLRLIFQAYFSNADIVVLDDLTAAAYATYQGEACLVNIFGTGSNTCFFDGTKIEKKYPSLGFILGDEGSGSALGKRLLKDFFMKKLPDTLHKEFEKNYNLDLATVLENVYKKPNPNSYLATFNQFLIEKIDHPYIKNLITEEFSHFIENQILTYLDNKNIQIHFVGSVAYYYRELLELTLEKYQLVLGNIVQKPIDTLVAYHKNNSK